MINITDKSQCVGCWACVLRCPTQCITIDEDDEGFRYPKVTMQQCIDCSLCERVCPVIHQDAPRQPLHTYAAFNPHDLVRSHSSSGGIFTLLADQVISAGGVVFGAIFDDQWNVVHSYTETSAGIAAFRGSKYVQSIIGNTYKQAEAFLKAGRKVLFSGTPCQIAGLHRYLRKAYDNLLSVDFICHGVPSPGVWRTYLQEECLGRHTAIGAQGRPYPVPPTDVTIKDIQFRHKKFGWNQYSFALRYDIQTAQEKTTHERYESRQQNLFMRGFLRDLYSRPSCYACPAKELKSGSDITLGDYWDIETLMPQLSDDKGMNAVVISTPKGEAAYHSLEVTSYDTPYESLCQRNSSILYSAAKPQQRQLFFNHDGKTFAQKIHACTRPSRKERLRYHLSVLLQTLLGTKGKFFLKRLLGR